MEFYEIVVKGHIDGRYVSWSEQTVIMLLTTGETSLVGPISDQAALYGILAVLRDLGLYLVSVKRMEQDPCLKHFDNKVE